MSYVAQWLFGGRSVTMFQRRYLIVVFAMSSLQFWLQDACYSKKWTKYIRKSSDRKKSLHWNLLQLLLTFIWPRHRFKLIKDFFGSWILSHKNDAESSKISTAVVDNEDSEWLDNLTAVGLGRDFLGWRKGVVSMSSIQTKPNYGNIWFLGIGGWVFYCTQYKLAA